LFLPQEGGIDVTAERARRTKELEKIQAEIAKVEQKLANPSFTAKAPPEVLLEHQKRLADWRAKLQRRLGRVAMTSREQKRALAAAVKAARAAGELMRRNRYARKKVNVRLAHDIKLELDVRCQAVITRTLAVAFPDVAVLGEEGITGDPEGRERWVVDPIDGTVNYFSGIPHACVSIALQERSVSSPAPPIAGKSAKPNYETVAGVVYDPFCDELWTAIRGQAARMNGRVIRVSSISSVREAVVSIGFAKSTTNLKRGLPYFGRLVGRARKVRIMGAAALGLAYVASGRFDAYIERGIRLWDIAAGGLIVECAGGEFWREPVKGDLAFRVMASNGRIRRKLGLDF
jgi:myo-inositol-1(or 4)-monophosphatase